METPDGFTMTTFPHILMRLTAVHPVSYPGVLNFLGLWPLFHSKFIRNPFINQNTTLMTKNSIKGFLLGLWLCMAGRTKSWALGKTILKGPWHRRENVAVFKLISCNSTHFVMGPICCCSFKVNILKFYTFCHEAEIKLSCLKLEWQCI